MIKYESIENNRSKSDNQKSINHLPVTRNINVTDNIH